MVMRSGYSKQGGFEIYLNDADLAEPLWDELFVQGEDLNVRAGGPNLIERIESGLLSYGNDISNFTHNPFECGLDAFIDLDAGYRVDEPAGIAPASRVYFRNTSWSVSCLTKCCRFR